ncbi:MAG TPA: flagellar motor protein MotA [Nitrococcus sp.]|nr:flagellar motor protein MotA [Nitrococcus sp.]
MRNPNRALVWMSLFLLVVGIVAAVMAAPLHRAFMGNAVFNSIILCVFTIGIVINYRQVLVLTPEVRWVEAFRRAEGELSLPRSQLLGSMARLLTGRYGEHFSLSTLSLRTLLDGIRSRLDEARDLSRYIVGLLVFLGLLGTFWGLLETLRAVAGIIGGLDLQGADSAAAVFGELKHGLQRPLSGMGTAFSSSLFGLAGALVLGFIDLQAGHAQNRFYYDLEEWLSGQTRLSSGSLIGEGEGSVPAYIHALLEQTADSLDKLQRIMARSEADRQAADHKLLNLTEQIANLVEQGRSEQKGLIGLTRMQSELQSVLDRLAEGLSGNEAHTQGASESLRHIARGITHLRQELAADRERLANEVREEVRLLARTVAHLGGEGRYSSQ